MSAVAIPALDSTMGATFIGVLVGATLYGVSCLQTWHYYREYSNDASSIKLLVAIVWLCDTVHQVLISHTMYTYVITNFANPAILGDLIWSLIVEVLFNGFTAVLVQSFLTLRIYRLSNKNIFITAIVSLFVVGQFCVTVAYTAKAIHMTTFAELATLKGLSMSVNALTVASDVSIALALCTLLHRSRTGFRASDSMINKLILFTMNTGLLTSLDAICSLASIAASPNTFIYICFFFTLGRLYSNSLLATLNARKAIRNGASSTEDTISLQGIPRTAAFDPTQKSQGNISIKIDTTHEYTRDHEYGSQSTYDNKKETAAL